MPVLVYKNERMEERADRRSWTPSDARLTWLEVQRQTLVGTLNVEIEKYILFYEKPRRRVEKNKDALLQFY